MNTFHRFVLQFVILVILGCNEASSENESNDMSYRLPGDIYPEFYRVDLVANLADYNENFTFIGRVTIQIRCKFPTNKIVIHSKNLVIEEPRVLVMTSYEKPQDENCGPKCVKKNRPIKILSHSYNDEFEFYIITLEETLISGAAYTLFIPYHGEIMQSLAGFYRSSYTDSATGEKRWLGVTQFESTDARRALPCFDEPAYKARFQLNLGHINTRTSISNMPVRATVPIENMENWVWDQYDITVPMSTYLLAFVVSDFSFKISPQTTSNNVLFRVWARRDAINQVDYATVVGPHVLDFFERYFDIRYPLPKMDMIAIPDFSSGAMENWGLITYREVALLYDPAVSTASSQPYVASVVTHEIAHQWFGNLVTMEWWTDLWLNEGFATYVSAIGVHYLHPEWNSFDEEAVENMMNVFSLDSLKSSHPISVPIVNPSEIAQIFDAISYKKGFFVLRMMHQFLGEKTFRNGVSNYLKKYAYRNAKQDDLWQSLTEEAHKNDVLPSYMTVKRIMDTWTIQTGYPVITVVRNYHTGALAVYQERYLGDRTDSCTENCDSKTRWWVPLSYTCQSEGDFNNTQPKEWLSDEQDSILISGLPCDGWIIFNIKISGLYRVKYDYENWNMLISALRQNHNSIGELNRVLLLEDSLNLAKTGDIDYQIPFSLLQYLPKENDYLPWKTALRGLGFIDKMLRFSSSYGYFRAFIQNLLNNIYESITSYSYENTPENLIKIKFQVLITGWACKFEVGNCVEKAIGMFNSWVTSSDPLNNNPIPKDFRAQVYCTAIRYGGEKQWNFLWSRYLSSNVGNERSLILSALGCTRETWLINRYLEWSIDEKSGIRKQDSTSVFAGIARGDVGYFLARIFFKNKLLDLHKFYGPKASRLGVYVSILANQITLENDLIDLQQFTEANEEYLRGAQKAVKQGLENAKINVQWQRKFYEKIVNYLQKEVMET